MPKLSGTKKPMDGILFITIIFTMCSLVVFVVVPLVNVLIQSFRSFDGTISGKAYVQAFTSEENLKALTHSLVLGVTSGALSTVIGFLFAIALHTLK